MSAAPLLVLLSMLSGGVAAEPLGRLFFTPEQRASADRARRSEAQGQDNARLRLDGTLTRSDGRATIWVNGQARHGSPAALGIAPQARGRATLAADGAPAILLRVGASIDTSTGETSDVIAAGSVRKSP